MSSVEAKGGCTDGMFLPTFPKNSSVAFRCVANLNPVPQVETPGQLSGPFSCGDWRWCFSVLPAAKNCLSDCYRQLGSRSTSPFDPRARQSRALLCVDCIPHRLHLVNLWLPVALLHPGKSVGGQACLQY